MAGRALRAIDIPAVIVGCGPSVVPVKWDPERYLVCAVNDARKMCERADVLAVNDTPALLRLDFFCFANLSTLLLPEHLHDDVKPSAVTNYAEAHGKLRSGFMLLHGCWPATYCLETYRLHTDPAVIQGKHPATFGRCRSTSDSLIAWLLSQGVRRFLLNGITTRKSDPCGWHPKMTCGEQKSMSHRLSIWNHTRRRIEEAEATWSAWNSE